MNYPNTWFTRSFLAWIAHKSNNIYNKIQNIWFPLPTYSVQHFPKQCLRRNLVLLNFCLCVYTSNSFFKKYFECAYKIDIIKGIYCPRCLFVILSNSSTIHTLKISCWATADTYSSKCLTLMMDLYLCLQTNDVLKIVTSFFSFLLKIKRLLSQFSYQRDNTCRIVRSIWNLHNIEIRNREMCTYGYVSKSSHVIYTGAMKIALFYDLLKICCSVVT